MASLRNDITYETEGTRLKEAFGATVTARRLGMRFEQREFSRVVGISNSHLRKIEAGETSPTLTTIAKIASALDTDATDLVNEACCRARMLDVERGPLTGSSPRMHSIPAHSRAGHSTTSLPSNL